jgi:hypothetical protein
MTVRVEITMGEDYPHLFVSDDPDDVAYRESPDAQPGAGVVVELTDDAWARFTRARDAYYALVAEMRERFIAAGGRDRA